MARASAPPPRPPHAQAALVRATALHRAGRLADAARVYEQVLRDDPQQPDALHLLGLVAHQRGDLPAAEPLIRQALARRPDDPTFLNSLGVVLLALKRPGDASRAFRQALVRKPDYAEASNNLGNALMRLGQAAEATAAYGTAIALRPAYAEAWTNQASALRGLDRHAEALASSERAIAIRADYANAHVTRGLILVDSARYDEALEAYDQALALDPNHPEARANRAVLLLLLGRFAEGWAEYEWRWRTEGFTTPPRDLGRPAWDGTADPDATLLLHAEQGLGSAIQFARYALLLAGRAGVVILECQPPLAGLFRHSFTPLAGPVASIVVKGDRLPAFDRQAPLMSLPHRFGTTLETIPAEVPYLKADPADVDTWQRCLAPYPRPRIGLVWAGNPRHGNDRHRSMPATALGPLLALDGPSFFALQVGDAERQLARLPSGRIENLAPRLADFAQTAAVVQNLDLVISVDTAVAHLAGALARPVWMLLPFVPEWRWMLAREDSPWYPTMRLFRQARPGDWAGVVGRVIEALAEFA
jgi:tetratricopeptide (TPR) repeat protein